MALEGISNLDVGLQLDAGDRLRVSQSTVLGDYKQDADTIPFLFNEKQVGGFPSTWDVTRGAAVMSVSSGQKIVRQSKMWHPYLSGQSHLGEMTFSRFAPETGVVKRIGYFDSTTVSPFATGLDGFFLESSNGIVTFQVWKNGSLKISIPQSSWTDPLDGSGPSEMNIDWDNFNVWLWSFLYLGGTGIAFGFKNGYRAVPVHVFDHANLYPSTIFNSPNKPLRYEIEGVSGAGTMDHVCCAVQTEGSLNNIGFPGSVNQANVQSDANVVGTAYALCGLRLKQAQRQKGILLTSGSALGATNDQFLIDIRLNPTVAGSWSGSWTDKTNYAVQENVGAGADETVTGGTILWSNYASANSSGQVNADNSYRIGSTIDGVMDEVVLCVIPLGSNLDIYGSLNFRQLA